MGWPAMVPFPTFIAAGSERSEGMVGVANQKEEAGRGVQPPQKFRVVGRPPHFLDSPPLLACGSGRLGEERVEPGKVRGQQLLGRRIEVGDELLGQSFDRLSAINEMRLGPVSVDGPKWLRQALDQAGMAKWLAPDEAMRQEGSLQQGRTRSPTSGKDKDGLLMAVTSCFR